MEASKREAEKTGTLPQAYRTSQELHRMVAFVIDNVFDVHWQHVDQNAEDAARFC